MKKLTLPLFSFDKKKQKSSKAMSLLSKDGGF